MPVMELIFDTQYFTSPFKNVTFPGKSEEENILYITREAPVTLALRLTYFFFGLAIFVLIGAFILKYLGETLGFSHIVPVILLLTLGFGVMMGGMWWVWQVYRKTVFIITTRRLTKFIHTTPWTRYQMSLGLDKVVDSGSYTKGYFQALFKLGTFVARSSAGNIKNFKIINIEYAEDLHNWMNKLMFTFNKETAKLDKFRPFVAKRQGMRY